MVPRCSFIYKYCLCRQMLYQDLYTDGDENETAPQFGTQALGKGLAELDTKKNTYCSHK